MLQHEADIGEYTTECYRERDERSFVTQVRVFTTKAFARFAGREQISERELCAAVRRLEKGIVADLGGGVIKQRLARKGQGKSGGFRSLVVFRRGARVFFVYGFAKSTRANIRHDELRAFRRLADQLLALDDQGLAAALKNRTVQEVMYHE